MMAETAKTLAGPAMVGPAGMADVAAGAVQTGASDADRHLRS